MKSSVSKLIIKGFISLSIGIFIFLLALVFNATLEETISDSFRGLIYGISVGLMSVGLVFMIIYFFKTRQPLTRKRFEAELNDERTHMVYQRAALFAMRCLPIIGALFIIVAYALNQTIVGTVLILFEYTIIIVFLGASLFFKNKM